MKTTPQLFRTLAALAATILLTHCVLAYSNAPALVAPQPPAGMPAPGIRTDGPTTLGVPREIFEKLPAEQAARLAQELARIESERQRGPSDLIPILGIIFVFGMPVAIVAIVMMTNLRRQRMLHETVRGMVEKGMPIPPELIQPPSERRSPERDFRSGLVWCAVGLGLLAFLGLTGNKAWPAGFIPLLIGGALLITWKVTARGRGTNPE